MWSKLETFEIRLDNPDHRFSPGDIISGRVTMDLTQPEIIRSLRVRFKGMAKVHWKRPEGSQRHTNNAVEEHYFGTDLYAVEKIEGETAELQTGFHEFPFQFCLPKNIPSSFDGLHGSVIYTIKAVMDRPLKIDYETLLFFAVHTPLDLNQCSMLAQSSHQQLLSAIDDEEVETFSCCSCFDYGVVKLKVFMPTNYFDIGEVIEAKINIDSTLTSFDVTKVELRLEQMVRLRTPLITKTETYVIKKVDEVRRFSKMDETILSIQVPRLPHSYLDHCSIIDIEYFLNVVISFLGYPCGIKRKYPILIGSMPSLNTEGENLTTIPAPVPTAPVFDIESPESREAMPEPQRHGNQNYSPRLPRPLGFLPSDPGQASSTDGSMENPPPSYHDIVDVNEKH